MCRYTEFFLVWKSTYSVLIRENTDQKKLRIWKVFTQCQYLKRMIELTKVAVGPLAYFGIYQVFETCIYKELSAYFDWRLSKQQCGFRKGFKNT